MAIANDAAIGMYLKYADAATLLNIKVSTLYCWVSRGTIPYVRLSARVVRFRRDDLEQWLEERRVPPTSPANPQRSARAT